MAAPAWADQVLRLHLGDLIPPRQAARMDDLIYPRVWVLSQRGAETEEGIEDSPGARLDAQKTVRAARVRRYQRPALALNYDFVESWAAARVARVERERPGRSLRGAQGLADVPGRRLQLRAATRARDRRHASGWAC